MHLSKEYEKRRSSLRDLVLQTGEKLLNLHVPSVQMFDNLDSFPAINRTSNSKKKSIDYSRNSAALPVGYMSFRHPSRQKEGSDQFENIQELQIDQN